MKFAYKLLSTILLLIILCSFPLSVKASSSTSTYVQSENPFEAELFIPLSAYGIDPDTSMPYTSMYQWYIDIAGGGVSNAGGRFGVVDLEILGDSLFGVVGRDAAGAGRNGVFFEYNMQLGVFEFADDVPEEGLHRIQVVGDYVFIAPTDRRDGGWEASNRNIYNHITNEPTVTPYYTNSSPVQVAVTESGVDGTYQFEDLKNAELYKVKFVTPPGYGYSVSPSNNNTSQDSNQRMGQKTTNESDISPAGVTTVCGDSDDRYQVYSNLTIDAGLNTSSINVTSAGSEAVGYKNTDYQLDNGVVIGGKVWDDIDTDGILDSGEVGLEGVRVELYTYDYIFPCAIHGWAAYVDPTDGKLFTSLSGYGYEGAIYSSMDNGLTWDLETHMPYDRPTAVIRRGNNFYVTGYELTNLEFDVYKFDSNFNPTGFLEYDDSELWLGYPSRPILFRGDILFQTRRHTAVSTVDTLFLLDENEELHSFEVEDPFSFAWRTYDLMLNLNDEEIIIPNEAGGLVRTVCDGDMTVFEQFSNQNRTYISTVYWEEDNSIILGSWNPTSADTTLAGVWKVSLDGMGGNYEGGSWNDLNRNGIRESWEPWIPDVVANLVNSNDQILCHSRTDATGQYLFDGRLLPGDYYVNFSTLETGITYYPTLKD